MIPLKENINPKNERSESVDILVFYKKK